MKLEAKYKQFHSTSILSEYIALVYKSLNSSNIFTYNENHYRLKKQFYLQQQLRGGGCCIQNNRSQPYTIITVQKLPLQFSQHMIEHSRIIESKALSVQNKPDKQLVITSLQWFIQNQEHFNTLCQDQKQGSKYIGSIQISLDLILKSILNYVTTSGYLCIELLSISNILVRVLYCYYCIFEKKKFNQNFKESLENYLTEFENAYKSNATLCWEFGIEFELEIMNIALAHIPTKSENPKNLLLGILQSITKFEISDKLIQSIFEYAKEILQKFVGKVKNPIEKYEVYCTFESIKWNIITQIIQRRQTHNIKIQLQNLYIQFIKNSQDWILHYCWIKMISDFLTYRPIVDINILLQGIRNPFERRKKWKDLIKDQCIEQLPYNINQAKCICFPNKQNVFQRSQFLREYSEIGITELSEFQQSLMTLDNQPDQQFWQFYIIYKQENEYEKEKHNELIQQKQQIQSLFNFIPIFQQLLDYLMNLLEKNENIIQKMNKLIQNLRNELIEADSNYQFEFLDQNSKIQTNTIEMTYVINEINLHIILMTHKLIFITESVIMENKSEFNNIVNNIRDQYAMQYSNHMNLFPRYLIEFLKTKFNWEDTLKYHFDRQTISNPFNTIHNQAFREFKMLSDQILEQVKQFKMIFEGQIYSKQLNIAEFILLNQFQVISNLNVEHFFSIFLDEITNNISNILNHSHDVQNDKRTYYLYQSIHIFLKISRFLLNIMQVRFYKNQPYQVMEALSSRRQGTLEDEIQNQSDDIKILIQKQQEQIQKVLIEDSKEQKDLSLTSLIDLVKRNINQIKKMQINNSAFKKNILEQMGIIQLDLMKLNDFCDNEFKEQFDAINDTHDNIFQKIELQNHLDQQQSQRQRDNESFFRQRNQESLSNNIDSIAKNLMTLLRLIESLKDSFELKFKIESEDLENLVASARKEIQKQIQQTYYKLIQNKIDFNQNLKKFLSNLATNYDTQIPYIDIYQFLDILQIFDLKDFHLQQLYQDSSNDHQAYLNLVNFYKYLKQYEYDPQMQQRDEQKIKQCLCYNLIKINSIILEEHLQNFSKKLIITIWIKEKDQRVKQLLSNEELIEIQNQLYSRNLEGFQQEIDLNVKSRVQDFDEYHNQILYEEDDEKKQILKIKLQEIEKDLDQYLLNISDMQAKLQINITTLIELRREFNNVKYNLSKLEQKLDDANLRIARLTGKKYEELLEIRKKNYLDRMNKNELEQLYVEQNFSLVNKNQGEDFKHNISSLIGDFMKDQKPEVMLIYGRSGVGKSTALNKIEQFIWKNQMLLDNKKIIPISASLAYLKSPTINLFKEILMQDKYGFNENQIRDFKEALTQNDQQVLFLLDSYDEMSNEFKYQNLYISNRFSELKNTQQNRNAIKLIIFCRKEFIKQQSFVQNQQNLNGSQYQTWFKFKNALIEAELLELENQQVENLIQQYTKLSVLLEIQNFQDKVFKQFEYNQISFFESQNDWKNLLPIIEESKNQSEQSLLNQHQLDQIINYLKGKNQFLNQNQNYINQMKTLRGNLQSLWSVEKYQSFANNLQIEELMKIPNLIKLILEVLPKLDQNFSEKQNNFIQNYYEVKQISMLQEKISSKINSLNSQTYTYQEGWHQFLKSYYSEIKVEIEKNINNLKNKGLFTKVLNNNFDDSNLNICQRELNINSKDIQIIIKALKIKQITIYDFLEKLSQAFLEKQALIFKLKGKIQDEENFKQDVFLFAESFSLEMIQNQDLSVQYKPQGQLQLFQKFSAYTEENWYDKYFHDKDINKEYFSLIRSAMLITQRGENFSFCHEKISQFYAAKSFYNLVNIIKINNSFWDEQFDNNYSQKKQIETIKQSWINQIQFNLSQIQYKEVFQILKQKVIKDKSFRKKLIKLIKICADPLMIQAASNIISFLGFMTKDLSNISLKGIQLQNTSLIGIDFSYSDLSESKFNNVNISDCNFTGSNLNNATWQNIINYNIKREIQNCDSDFQFKQYQQVVIFKKDAKFYSLELKNGEQPKEIFQNTKVFKCLDISNDGLYLASMQMNSSDINIQHFTDITQQWTLKENQKDVYKLQFSKQNEFLASIDKDNKIIIWNWQKQENITVIQTDQELCNLIFSYNNKYIALHKKNYIIELRHGEKWGKQTKYNELSVFAFSYDQMIASVSSTGNTWCFIQLLNLQQREKERQLKGHQDKINCLLFLSDKRSLISGGDDCFIILWNYQTGELKGRVQKYPQKIQFLNVSKDNRILGYYNQQKSIKFLDLQSFQSIHQLKHPSKKINQILFSKDGLRLICCNQSQQIKLWDMREGNELNKIKDEHDDKVISIAFSQNGQYLASAQDNKIIIWDFQDYPIKIKEIPGKSIKLIKFSKDDQYLAYLASFENFSQIMLISMKEMKESQKIKQKNVKFQDFCFSSDSQIFIFGGNTIYKWNKSEGLKLLQELNSECKYFAFSPCGHYFAISEDNNLITFYELQQQGILLILKFPYPNVNCIVFSPNENQTCLAIGSKQKIEIYNVQQKKIECVIPVDHQQDIEILQLSPNGLLLASVFQDKSIKIYDISLKRLIFTLPCSIQLFITQSEQSYLKNFLNEDLLQS